MAAMAVKSESLHHATEALILPKPRKFYRAPIETSHWQLRSLISSPEQNIVYYPFGSDVVALNTTTREREVFARLSFYPRCLTASKDWLCCGGDLGQYSAISLKDRSSNSDLLLGREADPEERLPLDLDPARRSAPRDMTSTPRRSPSRPALPDPVKIGAEIVNCVTLWTPENNASERAYKVPVAVVANNDCTVSILDVRDSEVLEKLTLPDYVNRSVISPDGKLLVTICDDPFLYVHERKQNAGFRRERFDTKDPQRYQWVLACRIQLEGQRQCDKSQNRGSFTACFSPSGKYLAVATQYGIISVFDAERLTDSDSLLVIFTTSRPGIESGAVRSMEFSPAPFDLLAWTEHNGRVGVADVRSLFHSRQLVKINSQAEAVERVNVSDRHGEAVIDPRLRNVQNESPSHSSTPDYLGLDLERRQLRHLTREMLDRHHTPVTAEELEVLQAHRIARRQRDAANAAREALAEGSGRWSAWGDDRASTAADGEGPGSTSRRISTSGLPAALREFVNPDRTTASFRSFINERNHENERRSQLQQEPRRRGSMIIAATENLIERETLGTGTRTGNDTSNTLERLTLTPSRLEAFGSDSPNNPWAEIDALYRSRFPGDPPIDRSTRLRVEVAAADEEPRDFAHRLRQPWRPLGALSPVEGRASNGVGLRAVETMGCAWSQDGRILYVGAQDGIHEYHVNVPGRKKFPSLVMR